MVQGSRTFRQGELLAILGEVYRDKGTGTLVLQNGQTNKFLYAQEGDFIFAASNAPEDKFTQILVEKGRLTPEQLDLATEKKENRTIGRTLVEMGFLGSEDLLDALVEQMRKIARSAAHWDEGLAVFKAGVLPPNIARLPLPTPRFIVDTALTLEDRSWVATTLGRMEVPLVISPAEREVARALPATAEELRLLEQIDGKRNAREVCERAGTDSFNGAKFLLALTHLGLLHLQPGFAPAPSSRTQTEPVDLSFLDEIAPSGKAAQAAPPPAAPKSAPAAPPPRPAEPAAAPSSFEIPATPAPAPPGKPALPFDGTPSETLAAPAFGSAGSPGSGRDLPPPAGNAGPSSPGSEESVLFEDIGERRRQKGGRYLLLAGATAAVLAVAVAVVWYFFLRPSEMIPLTPVRPTATAKRRPAPATSAPVSPAPAAATSSAPGPATAAPPSPAPVQVTAPGSLPTAAAKAPAPAPAPTPAPATAPAKAPAQPAPQASPKPAVPAPKSNPPSEPSATAGHSLLAAGKYPEAAGAFAADRAKSASGFTVLIEVACQPDTIAKGAAAAAGRPEYGILPYDLKGRSCYLVTWGSYPDRAAAEAAMKGLPALFQPPASQPRVIPMAKVLELSRGK